MRPWEAMRLTIPELELLTSTQAEQAEMENENQIYYHHLASSLNSFAFHDPKHFPKLWDIIPRKKAATYVPEKQIQKALEKAKKLGHFE